MCKCSKTKAIKNFAKKMPVERHRKKIIKFYLRQEIFLFPMEMYQNYIVVCELYLLNLS